jgi:acetyltransferase
MTMPDDRAQKVAVGPVAIVGQSGGIAMAIKRTLEERGTDTSIVVTSGNEAGLTTADYISYFAELPEIRVIVSYLESVHGSPDAFLAACRKARAAGKPVIILKLGASDEGRQAAMAHTGALAGSIAAFDAVATAAGAMRMRNTDDVVEAVELLLHTKIPAGPRCGGITLSGGMRGLLMDAASAHGLAFEPLSAATAGRLRQQLAVGAQLANPIDGGFAALTNPNALFECVEAMIADPAIDVVLVQEELPRAPGTERKERNIMRIDELAASAGKPVAFVSMISHSSNDYTREFRAKVPHVAFLQECDKSLRVLATVIRAGEAARRAEVHPRDPDAGRRKAIQLIRARAGQRVLNEVDSKAVLAAYGVPVPRERLVKSRDEAVAAARDLGGPVVAKIVSAGIAHKSEVGGVKVGLAGDDAVAAAYDQLSAIPARVGADFDGVLVAEMVRGGTEVVLGAKWDPEMGPVVVFGSGGIAVELYQDVALAAAPLDEAAAADLIARTRVGRLIEGFRGGAPLDKAGLCRSLMALGDLMRDAEGEIVEIDVNPVLVTPTGSVALDGLIVLRGAA